MRKPEFQEQMPPVPPSNLPVQTQGPANTPQWIRVCNGQDDCWLYNNSRRR